MHHLGSATPAARCQGGQEGCCGKRYAYLSITNFLLHLTVMRQDSNAVR